MARRLRADDCVHFFDLDYRRIARLAFQAVAVEQPALAEALGVAEAVLGA